MVNDILTLLTLGNISKSAPQKFDAALGEQFGVCGEASVKRRLLTYKSIKTTGAEKTIGEVALLAAPKMVRHYIFNVFRGNSSSSQKYRDFFAAHHIDIDNFCVEIPQSFHVSQIHAMKHNWTTKWKQWIDTHPNASTKEVYQQAGLMMDEYGISHVPLVAYRVNKR